MKPRRFTLVEMLVVIAIIVILMGMLMGGLAISRQKAKKVKARSQIRMLETALSSYRTTYTLLPFAPRDGSAPQDILLYGTVYNAADADSPLTLYQPYPNMTDLLLALNGIYGGYNPRKIQFIDSATIERDPWGATFRVALDLDADDLIQGVAGQDLVWGAGTVNASFDSWSPGPDNEDDEDLGPNTGVNADNMNSWEKN